MSVSITSYSCFNVGRLNVKYGAEVQSVAVYRSDALGNWDHDGSTVRYANGTAGEFTFLPGQWPGTPGGYVLVAARPGCADWKGISTVSVQIVKVPQGECPVFPPPPVKTTELFAIMQTPGDIPAKFRKEASPSMRMQVALGTVFSLGLQVRGAPLEPVETIPSIVSRNVATVTPPQKLLPTATVVPKVITAFPTETLVQLGLDQFLAVHLGTQTVNVLSTTTTLAPITLTVEVVSPTNLGTTLNEYDHYFSMVAHNTGVPPQYVKGQAVQEKGGRKFKELNWRYEPCGTDYDSVSRGARLAFTNTNYARFRLDDQIGVTLIPGTADDLDPRNEFFVKRVNPLTGQTEDHRLTDDDRQITARAIWDDNDTITGNGHIRQNWSVSCGDDKLDAIQNDDPDVLDFVAQTVLASSYGFQQVMWEEALKSKYWEGVAETTGSETTYSKAPKYLFERSEYVNKGGGSVQLGLNKIVDSWTRSSSSSYENIAKFEAPLNKAFRLYNWWYISNGKRYGTLVIENSRSVPPAQTPIVFP